MPRFFHPRRELVAAFHQDRRLATLLPVHLRRRAGLNGMEKIDQLELEIIGLGRCCRASHEYFVSVIATRREKRDGLALSLANFKNALFSSDTQAVGEAMGLRKCHDARHRASLQFSVEVDNAVC